MPAQVMGVLNVTPDSFSDGGSFLAVEAAVRHGMTMLADGADVIDVGGESTRPGADSVPPEVEKERVVPVIEALAGPASAAGARVSVDTRHAQTARAAVAAGATFVNDVSAELGEVAAELRVAWCAMHMRGTPATMQSDPRYDDVVAEVGMHLSERAAAAAEAGCPEVWIDPGIGFGKTFDHNWTLLAGLDRLCELGWPVLVGTSRKGFLGELTARSDGVAAVDTGDRLEASLATAVWAAVMGASMVRAHDVRSTVHAVTVAGTSRPEKVLTRPPAGQPGLRGRERPPEGQH